MKDIELNDDLSMNSNVDKDNIEKDSQSDNYSIDEAVFISGLTESTKVKEINNSYRTKRNIRFRNANDNHNLGVESLKRELSRLETDREKNNEKISSLENEIEKLKNEIDGKQNKLELTKNKKEELDDTLSANRIKYPEKIIEEKIHKYEKYNNQIVDIINKQAHESYEREVELRKLNEKEFTRRIEYFEKLKNKAEKILDELESYINTLRKFGVTRISTGFLVWSGYFALPAIGWFLGGNINHLHGDNNRFFEIFLKLIVSAISNISSKIGNIETFFVIILLPLVFVLLVFTVIFFVDKVLLKLDAKWQSTRRKSKGGYDKNVGFTNLFVDPDRDYTRADFSKILSRLPIIYIWILIPFSIGYLFTFSNESTNIDDFIASISIPGNTILYTYLAIVISLITTSIVLLYSMKIIEPRIQTLIKKEIISYKDTIKANIEIFSLMILFLLLVLPGELIANQIYGYSLWHINNTIIIITLLLLLSFGLAYGLIYRGIFKDQEYFISVINKYDNKIMEYTALPIIKSNDENVEKFIENLKDLQNEIKYILWNVDFWKEPIKPLRKGLFSNNLFNDSEQEKNTKGFKTNIETVDLYFEPQIVDELKKNYQLLSNLNSEIEGRTNKINNTIIEINEFNEKNANISIVIREYEERIINLNNKYYDDINNISDSYLKESTISDSLYKMGKKLRERTNPKGK